MPYDYTDAPPPQFELIAANTIAAMSLHINAGGVGEDGVLTRSKDGGSEVLAVVLTVVDGQYKTRKWKEWWVLEGTTDGHAISIGKNRRKLKLILDSALGLNPQDESPSARAARTVSPRQFEGITFIGRIDIKKGDGNWSDQNVLAEVITPDKKDWHRVEQPPPFNGGSAPSSSAPGSAAPPIQRPGWAS